MGFATWATVVLIALLKSALLDLTCSSATVTRKAATALVVVSAITQAVSASASLDTSVPSASTRLFLAKEQRFLLAGFLIRLSRPEGMPRWAMYRTYCVANLIESDKMSRSPKHPHPHHPLNEVHSMMPFTSATRPEHLKPAPISSHLRV